MNRFVSIYLDEIIINKDNINVIITKTLDHLYKFNNQSKRNNNNIEENIKDIFINKQIKSNLKSTVGKIQNLYCLYDNIGKYKLSLEKRYNY